MDHDVAVRVYDGGREAEFCKVAGGPAVYVLRAVADDPEVAAAVLETGGPAWDWRWLRRDGSVVGGRPDEWYGWLMDMAYEAGWG